MCELMRPLLGLLWCADRMSEDLFISFAPDTLADLKVGVGADRQAMSLPVC